MNFGAFSILFPYKIIHIDRAYLKNNLQTPFYQWIDGSFVTSKQNPNDIDTVTFIPHFEYEKILTNYKNYWTSLFKTHINRQLFCKACYFRVATFILKKMAGSMRKELFK